MTPTHESLGHASAWLAFINQHIQQDFGVLDIPAFNESLHFEWRKVNGASPYLNDIIKSTSALLADVYTHMELEFARAYPQQVAHEHFLKGVAPYFNQGIDQVPWPIVQKELYQQFHTFFSTTDFAQFSKANELHIFVIARQRTTYIPLSVIQFTIAPDYAYGTVKIGLKSEMSDPLLERAMLSTIFKLLPAAIKLFLHTRSTNAPALAAYRSWGFIDVPETLPHWTNLEYLATHSTYLQDIAKAFTA